MNEHLFSQVKRLNIPASHLLSETDREALIRHPEPAAEDVDYRQWYTTAMIEVMAALAQHLDVNPDEPRAPILEIPNGGTLPSLLIRQELHTNERYVVPKAIVKEARKSFFALRSVIHQLNTQHTPLTDHYVIPEDTIESGQTLQLVMMALTLYCQQHDHQPPRFTLLVPTIDVRHLDVSTSQIRQWAERRHITVEIVYAYEETYSAENRPPEHGVAHALIATLLSQTEPMESH